MQRADHDGEGEEGGGPARKSTTLNFIAKIAIPQHALYAGALVCVALENAATVWDKAGQGASRM
jgi:hypothetical protein